MNNEADAIERIRASGTLVTEIDNFDVWIEASSATFRDFEDRLNPHLIVQIREVVDL